MSEHRSVPSHGRRAAKGGDGQKRSRVLAWVSIVVTGVFVIVSLTGYTLFRSALGNVRTEDPNKDIVNARPANLTGALNVLIVGSDTRDGKGNARYGQQAARMGAGKRTDTIILMHISPTRDKATLISFPRDSMVDIPQCKNEANKNQIMPPRRDMINAAYSAGGIACTMTTIETLTDIRVDHFVEVDFSGFKNIVDALGGIQICLKNPVNDKASKLQLPRGRQTLDGEKALGYVRLRHYGDGSDIQRIKRQQIFLSQVVKKATSGDLLGNPIKLVDFVNSAAASVTMDKDLAGNSSKLLEIAQSAKSLTASGVKFITVPWIPDPEKPEARVVWNPTLAPKLFQAIKSDVDIPTPSPSASASTKPKVALKPHQVKVQVLNGTTTQGKAKQVADALSEQGFQVVGVGNAPPPAAGAAKTKLLYAKKATDALDYTDVVNGKLLTKVTPGAGKLKPSSTEVYTWTGASATPPPAEGGDGQPPVLQLIVGDDFKGVKASTEIPEAIKDSAVTADTKNICS